MIKERPIIFNTEMVKAILDGSKTVTRRPVKPQPKTHHWETFKSYKINCCDLGNGNFRFRHSYKERGGQLCGGEYDGTVFSCPFGQIGDSLYVRETFLIGEIEEGFEAPHENEYLIHNDIHGKPLYYADHIDFKNLNNIIRSKDYDDCKWSPSIHMPKKYARIWLEITDIRVERVQDITTAQAWDEGSKCSCTSPTYSCAGNIESFSKTWNSLYKNWSENPWVWVIEFRRIDK